jgi:hypothetical protein
MGITFAAVAAEHPPPGCKNNPALATFIGGGAASGAELATMERRACERPVRAASLHEREGRGLGRELRAHGLRRGRVDGGSGPRRARLRLREEIQPADRPGDRRRRQGVLHRRAPGLVRDVWPHDQLGQVRRPRP